MKLIISIRKILLILVPILILATMILAVYLYIMGEWGLSYKDVRIDNFALCDMYGNTTIDLEDINRGGKIYVCGELISQNNLWMIMDLMLLDTNDYISSVPVTDQRYYPGFFIRHIEIPNTLSPGIYEIQVLLERKIIATLQFNIIEQ